MMGQPVHKCDPPIMERFLSRIEKTATCWIWKGSIIPGYYGGYGHLKIKQKGVGAHRAAYELFKGKIPNGLTIDHLCRNRKRVNPDHLEVVTMKENILRGSSPSAILARQTHCKKGHPFTTKNTYFIKQSKTHGPMRQCKTCKGIKSCL